MNCIIDNFTYTTADEQKSYFSGEYQNNNFPDEKNEILLPGTYRIIDGQLSRIITGASPDMIKKHFESITKINND
jgi:hypothetical protein